MQSVAFRAGDTIIREGDEGDTAFFIVSGAVEGTDCAAVVAAIDKNGTGECDGPAEDGDPCKRRLGHRNEPKGESGKG